MLVTMSGPPGSGTSSAGAALADRLGLEHVSGGDLFRGLADERGMTVEEFNEEAESDESIDRELDWRLRTTAIERDDLVLESRLAGWMAGEHADLRFWLDAPPIVRARRIADREDWSVGEARDRTAMRQKSERRRYAEYYNIDFDDLRIYDLAINTGRWPLEAELELLVDAVESYDPGEDEGAVQITDVEYPFE